MRTVAEVVWTVYTAGAIFVDGLGVGDVGNIVLRDRQHLAEDGIIIVVLTLEAVPDSFWPDRISYPADLFMCADQKD